MSDHLKGYEIRELGVDAANGGKTRERDFRKSADAQEFREAKQREEERLKRERGW